MLVLSANFDEIEGIYFFGKQYEEAKAEIMQISAFLRSLLIVECLYPKEKGVLSNPFL